MGISLNSEKYSSTDEGSGIWNVLMKIERKHIDEPIVQREPHAVWQE